MSIINVDTAVLRTFSTIVEAGTFHAAASQIGLTQSAVSQQMKSLEELLEIELFERSGRIKLLTKNGHQIYLLAKALLNVNDALIVHARDIKNNNSAEVSK